MQAASLIIYKSYSLRYTSVSYLTMEFCYKFYDNMEFQVVSFGLWLSLLTLNGVESDCNYFQILESGQTYYAYNPNYPNYYKGNNNCIWEMRSVYAIEIQCNIEMPFSYNCNSDSLSIQFANNNAPMKYCGKGTLVLKGPNAIIKFNSQDNTPGGRFLCTIQTLNNNCNCGWKKETRIVGGEETERNEYPMMCGLIDVNVDPNYIYCGGTIISDQYITTAAHCIENRNTNGIGVVIGAHDVTTNTNATRVLHLEGCKIYPWYNSEKNAFNDIAICKTIETIKFSAEVGPACLPFLHRQDTFENDTVTALGWGTEEFGGKQPDKLQKVNLIVISYHSCKRAYPNVDYSNMCTYANGKDTCQRDSGGPLLWYNSNTNKLVLVGITSSGVGCASNLPAIAMRIGAFIDWIIQATPDAKYCEIE